MAALQEAAVCWGWEGDCRPSESRSWVNSILGCEDPPAWVRLGEKWGGGWCRLGGGVLCTYALVCVVMVVVNGHSAVHRQQLNYCEKFKFDIWPCRSL